MLGQQWQETLFENIELKIPLDRKLTLIDFAKGKKN
jgi:hypothetical protein